MSKSSGSDDILSHLSSSETSLASGKSNKSQKRAMKPRHYIHMGPRAAEKVSRIWKDSHMLLFGLILIASALASVSVYNLLDMYRFNCILYAHASFETSFEKRFTTTVSGSNDTSGLSATPNISATTVKGRENDVDEIKANQTKKPKDLDKVVDNSTVDHLDVNKTKLSNNERQPKIRRKRKVNAKPMINFNKTSTTKITTTDDPVRKASKKHVGDGFDKEAYRNYVNKINTTGFLNMRKTIFATVYMCNLILFTPLASAIMAIFLGALIMVGGKGGAGNPGDLLPNPWICVYPFLGLCAFMMVFSFISNTTFQNGFSLFCFEYYNLTKVKTCSEKMNPYNVQFSENARGPPRDFYLMYRIGSICIGCISMLWLFQTLVYIMRIIWLADFTIYLTTIRHASDDKADNKLAGVVLQAMMDPAKNK